MEVSGSVIWVGGYRAVEEPLLPLPENWNCPEDLAAMTRPKMYTLEKLLPRSCFPVTLWEDQLSEINTSAVDPWGTDMIPLTEKECCWTCRMFQTWALRWDAEIELENIKSELILFKADLGLSNAELSKKEFSFTLDKESSLQIIDFKSILTSKEKSQLLEGINAYTPLISAIHRHANALITLASYFKDKEGNGKLTQGNFNELINYQALISSLDRGDTLSLKFDSSAANSPDRSLINIEA